jgi:hypothetical protein
MSDKTIPDEDVKAILGSLKDPKLANLKAKIEKRGEVQPQTSSTDTRNWDDRAFTASTSSMGRNFMTYFTDKEAVSVDEKSATEPKPKK